MSAVLLPHAHKFPFGSAAAQIETAYSPNYSSLLRLGGG